MTDETDSSVVLAELFRECSTQRLSSQGRPFSCSLDPVTDLLKQLWSSHQLEQDLVLLVYYQLQQTSPFSVMLLLISVSLRRIGFRSSSGNLLQFRTALSSQLPWLYSYEQYSVHLLEVRSFSSWYFDLFALSTYPVLFCFLH